MFWRKKRRDSAPSVDEYLRDVNGPPTAVTGAPGQAPPSEFGPPVPPAASVPAGGFSLVVVDVFRITGRGTVVTGVLADGVARVGQQVAIVRDGAHVASSELGGIEAFRRVREEAAPGENVGLLLRGLSKDRVKRGDIVAGR
ncbi:hypothetical protein EXU48_00405 [Occultella glacieicola]|uniref:Translation elongation factor EFTu-like domain-containing protein n=1 Tax=Occultella glacieicola TaxID=2518684 RepID=A0ABY2E878_9MICO|nr:EF-Tu/IF-2/RF-3 family GTPase [Occultella glacieicola]TDE98714.1 hypothetical protein EXU48_00405 [Occultella glacieicola]